MPHIPVLLNETLEGLDLKPGKFIIDGTANGGGHLRAIIERMGEGKILAVEWDKDILERTKVRLNAKFQNPNDKLEIIWANDNYAHIPEILEREKLGKADGLLLDLGFSTEQLESQKGFSFKEKDADEPLDMRYDTTEGLPTAAEVINSLREEDLANIIFQYGEERFSRYIAKGIVESRKEERIITVRQLVEIVKKSVPKFFKKGEMDVVARTFQAIRIYVNAELENLESILKSIPDIMAIGGRAAIITFHSLEDRMVKKRFADLEKEGRAKIINKKPIGPTQEETARNPASRSAKLRVIEIHPG